MKAGVTQLSPKQQTVWIDPTLFKKTLVQSKAGQISDQAAPHAYLGEKTRIVEKEQVARYKKQGKKGSERVKKPTQKPLPKFLTGDLAKFGVPMFPSKTLEDQPKWVEHGKGHGGIDPTYVEGVKKGETTALNTKEFIFYGYFERIRRRLDRAWEPLLKGHIMKLYRKGRQLASDTKHITSTLVILNDRGEIIQVQVLGKSGVRDLDSAAVEAFNKAGPFPNPPSGLVNQHKRIEIKWDFILRT